MIKYLPIINDVTDEPEHDDSALVIQHIFVKELVQLAFLLVFETSKLRLEAVLVHLAERLGLQIWLVRILFLLTDEQKTLINVVHGKDGSLDLMQWIHATLLDQTHSHLNQRRNLVLPSKHLKWNIRITN